MVGDGESEERIFGRREPRYEMVFEVGFVKVKKCMLSLKALVARAHVSPLEHFKKVCGRLGGKVVEEEDGVVSCIVKTFASPEVELVENVGEFYRFVERWKHVLDKPIGLLYENELLGEWSEVANVEFDPRKNEFTIYLHLYTDHAIPAWEVKDVVPKEIEQTKKVERLRGVEIYGNAGVSQNPATDEFAGEADVWAKVPLSKASPTLLEDVVEEASKFASELAEEAEELFIIPETEW